MSLALRILTALGLFIDAGVHIHLAPGYPPAGPGQIGQGSLFLLEGAAALLAGLYVLIRGSRAAYATALVVAFSGFVAVVLYRYVDVPAFGPIPAMYDPVWFFEKSLSAVAEGLATVFGAMGLVRSARTRQQVNAP
jgi:hypothetical protein